MADSIPVGEVWSILGNESVGTLTLFHHADGNVDGRIYGNKIRGFWNEDSQTLAFIRIPSGTQPRDHQFYTGYKFSWQDNSGATVHCLAGSFKVFAGTGTSAQRNIFGWYAIQTGSTMIRGDDPAKRLKQDIEHNFPHQDVQLTKYKVLANGHLGTLTLPKGAGGRVDAGEIYGQKITGFRNDVAGRTSFIRIPPPNVRGSYQVYTGYRIEVSISGVESTGWAGSFEAFDGLGATAKRRIYGWYALARYHTLKE